MQVENIEVRSKGVVVGRVDIQKFDSIAEAINHFQAEENTAAAAGNRPAVPNQGEMDVLGLVNSQHRANLANAKRVELTRGVSPLKALRERLKSGDAKAKTLIMSVLAELDIEADEEDLV